MGSASGHDFSQALGDSIFFCCCLVCVWEVMGWGGGGGGIDMIHTYSQNRIVKFFFAQK